MIPNQGLIRPFSQFDSGAGMKTGDPNFNALYIYTKALSVALGYRDLLTRLHSERVRDL